MVKIDNISLGEFPLLLAPMEDVSDPPFRALCKKHGADLMYTEFISSEGLIRDAAKSVQKLDIYEYERPIGIQIFGSEIESMIQAAEITEASNPDIIDINYGCPVKKVACKGAGAGILQDIPKMVRMTAEIVKRCTLPVTVKTRLGWDEQSKHIVEVAERLQEALEYKNTYGVDGIMIGRASIGNPWVFNQIKEYIFNGKTIAPPTLAEKVEAVRYHLSRSIEWKGDRLGVVEMRRHYANYFKGIQNFKSYRQILVTEENPEILFATLDEIAKEFIEEAV